MTATCAIDADPFTTTYTIDVDPFTRITVATDFAWVVVRSYVRVGRDGWEMVDVTGMSPAKATDLSTALLDVANTITDHGDDR